MPLMRKTLILFIVFIASGYLRQADSASAQAGSAGGWSIPFNLSESDTSSESPTIIADPYGFLHVFWSEDVFGPMHVEYSAPKAGNTIMYRRFGNGTWSDPLDIVFAGYNGRADNPEAFVDDDGILHLTWLQDRSLMYSFVPVWEAAVIRAWSKPVQVSEGWIIENRLVSAGDEIVAIFSMIDGQAPGLYAVSVTPEAEAAPVLIWSGLNSYVPQHTTAAVDDRGRIHVAWEVIQYPNPAAIEVRYSRSADGGYIWTESRLVAKTTGLEDQVNDPAPWVAARGEDEIHIQWAQGVHTYRWHQFSSDGGDTWTQPVQLWEEFISQTRSFAVGTDSSGSLYWADVLRFPNGGYLMQWTPRGWSYPEMFYEIQRDESSLAINRVHIHGIRMAFRYGNEMHLVFKDQDRAEIWTMYRTVPAKRVEPQAVPTPVPTPAEGEQAEAVVMSAAGSESKPTPPPISNTWDDNQMAENPGAILISGLLPVVLLIAIIAVVRRRM